MRLTFFTTILFAGVAALHAAELKIPVIFGDHMVLQQGREIPVWGSATPGEKVTITLNGRSSETAANAEGKWRLSLPAMPTSKDPLQMTVKCGLETIRYNDVLLGDAWLCSGQSNMGMRVGATKRAKEIAAAADHPQIRLFLVERNVAFQPASEAPGKWVVCSPESVPGFSAVAYHFGLALQQSQQVPIGLIGTYVGGSHIFAWTSRETLAAAPARSTAHKRIMEHDRDMQTLPERVRKYDEELKPAWDRALAERKAKYGNAMEAFKKAAVEARAAGLPAPARPVVQPMEKHPAPPMGDFSQASSLYNGMVHPLAPFALKGVIWYQGEANTYPGMDVEYQADLIAMISNWRQLWNQHDLPFLVVQLPNLISDKDTWPVLRESQRLAAQKTPACGLVATCDVGDPADLHPAEKQPIGERLALLARAMVYQEDVIGSGPVIRSARQDGNGIELVFEQTGGGLMTGSISAPAFRGTPSPGQVKGFEVATENRNFLPARAEIKGDRVFIATTSGAAPIRFVRYAWAPNPEANLYNKAGLPAIPFEIETSR